METEIMAWNAFSSMSPQTAHELMLPQQYLATGQIMNNTLIGYALIIAVIAFVILVCAAAQERKSYKYRKIITDMYVAGSVRKLAKEDGISIEEEYKTFQKFDKKSKRENKMLDLDATIEENLKDIQEERNNEAIERLSDDKSSEDVVVIKKK